MGSMKPKHAAAVALGSVQTVPVTALLATSGHSYAVQEATPPHKLLPVRVGLFAAGEKPTDDKLDSLTMAVYAAREFETSDPDFADVLFDTESLFKRL